jgi:hypothetical protein
MGQPVPTTAGAITLLRSAIPATRNSPWLFVDGREPLQGHTSTRSCIDNALDVRSGSFMLRDAWCLRCPSVARAGPFSRLEDNSTRLRRGWSLLTRIARPPRGDARESSGSVDTRNARRACPVPMGHDRPHVLAHRSSQGSRVYLTRIVSLPREPNAPVPRGGLPPSQRGALLLTYQPADPPKDPRYTPRGVAVCLTIQRPCTAMICARRKEDPSFSSRGSLPILANKPDRPAIGSLPASERTRFLGLSCTWL